jgi:hypothetical protein
MGGDNKSELNPDARCRLLADFSNTNTNTEDAKTVRKIL